MLSLGLAFLVSLPCSGAAWYLAARARARIDSGELDAPRGRAEASYRLGLAGVVLAVLAAVGWTLAISAGVDLQELQRSLERQAHPDASGALVQWARAVAGHRHG